MRGRTRQTTRGIRLAGWFAAVSAVALLLVVVIWGRRLEAREPRIKIGAAPFVGQWDWRPSVGLLPAIVVGMVLVAVVPPRLRRWRFQVSAWAAGVGLSAFAFLLAASDGLSAVLAPVVHPTEYWVNLSTLPPAGEMVRSFSSYDFLVDRSVHLKGHPPGFILILKALASVGLGRPWVAGALSFLGAAFVVPAVALTVRALAGEAVARRTLPFLSCAPFVLWLGTSADAFYTAVCAWGIAALAFALTSDHRSRRIVLGFVSGLLLGGGLFLSYGVATLLCLPLVIALSFVRRQFKVVLEVGASATFGAALVTLGFARAGFWWFDGLSLTREFYWVGSAYFRTWTYFMFANVVVLMIAVGPAVSVGVWRLRNRVTWVLVGGALLGIAVAEVSQYSKGEVERIWLLAMPWLVPAASSLSSPIEGRDRTRLWLAAQVTIAVVLQAWLRSKW